jgi:hypothetical protein
MSTNESPKDSAATGNSGKNRYDLSFKALAIEVTSIVVGVLLALGLSEWSEERKYREQAEIALDNIASEIRANHKLLTTIHDNNMATLQAMSDERDPDAGEDRNFIPGLQLYETAWETFLSTGLANYASYDRVLVLSQVYAIQEIYKLTGRQLVDATMMMSAYAAVQETDVDNNHFQKQFVTYFGLLSDIETQLLIAYEGVIGDIGTEN